MCAYVGNAFGEETLRRWQALDAESKRLLDNDWSAESVAVGVQVHLLGAAGAGTTTLRHSLQRG
jgi:ABC-type cobalamin transport system ATPase subunit